MSATKKTTTSPAIDWSPVPRGPVGACAQAAVGLVALAGAANLADVNPVLGVAGTGLGLLSHTLVGMWRDYGPGALAYRIACWSGAGGWWTWTQIGDGEHLWSAGSLAALAIGATCAGITAPIGRHRPAATEQASTDLVPLAARTVATRPGGQLGFEWEMRFRRVARVPVVVSDIRPWTNGAGYDVVCELPPGPATRKSIAAAAEALATDARLPEGCGVEIKPNGHRAAFIAAVSTVNRLGTPGESVKLPYPADYSPRSILDAIEMGEHRDASIASSELREQSVLVTGRKGGGKTNLLDVLTLGIGRCRDALVWHIDCNGGGMSQFWLHPWLTGQSERPAIDWAASTPEEALLMVTVAVAAAKDRKTSYRTLKAQANTKLLPVSSKLPEIVIMVDEGAEILNPANRDPIAKQVREGLEELQRIGRNEAWNLVISSLRPTQDMISPAILKQSAVKMALYGLDEPDLGHLYGWRQDLSMDELPTMGCAFLGNGSDVRPMKAWFLEPDQIQAAALAIADMRPELDAAGAEIADDEYEISLGGRDSMFVSNVYSERYERMRAAFGNSDGGQEVVPARPAPAPAAPAARPAPTSPPLRVVGGSATSWPDPMDARPAPTAPATATAWPDPLPGRTTPPVNRPVRQPQTRPIPEILTRVLQAFADAGDDRMHSETLAEALGIADPWALAEQLRPHGLTTAPNKFKRGGLERRGYRLEDVRAACERITSAA